MSTIKKPVSKPAPKASPTVVEADAAKALGMDLAKQETAVASVQPSILPALSGASPELIERMNEVRDNLESVEQFRLPRAKMTASGLELIEGDVPLMEVEGTMVHTKRTNVYYDSPYNAQDVKPPTCFSPDGITPSDGNGLEGYKKQHATCKGCPQAEFGTNSMKSGKACRNLKPMYLLMGEESIMPRQLTVTPASLKSANQYLMDLTERGISYRKVRTKITLFKDNPRDTYFKMRFAISKRLDEQEQKNVEFLRNQWLPIMNAQGVDASEIQSEQGASAQPVTPSNEY